MAKRIVLEETGERRIPTGMELYLYEGEVFNWENSDDEPLDKPENFSILRVVQNDFDESPMPWCEYCQCYHHLTAQHIACRMVISPMNEIKVDIYCDRAVRYGRSFEGFWEQRYITGFPLTQISMEGVTRSLSEIDRKSVIDAIDCITGVKNG